MTTEDIKLLANNSHIDNDQLQDDINNTQKEIMCLRKIILTAELEISTRQLFIKNLEKLQNLRAKNLIKHIQNHPATPIYS